MIRIGSYRTRGNLRTTFASNHSIEWSTTQSGVVFRASAFFSRWVKKAILNCLSNHAEFCVICPTLTEACRYEKPTPLDFPPGCGGSACSGSPACAVLVAGESGRADSPFGPTARSTAFMRDARCSSGLDEHRVGRLTQPLGSQTEVSGPPDSPATRTQHGR